MDLKQAPWDSRTICTETSLHLFSQTLAEHVLRASALETFALSPSFSAYPQPPGLSIARVILLLILLLVFAGKLYLEEFCCCDKLDKPPLHSSLNTGRKCSRHLAETPVSEILHARQHGCALCPQQHFLVPALQLGVLDLNLSSISHLWISVSSQVAGH